MERGRATWAVYLLLGLFAYLETAVGPVMPFVRARLDVGYTVASLHFAAFAAGGVIVGFGGERLVRRWGRAWALWGGIAGMVAGAVLLAVSPSVVGTMLGAFAMGVCGTFSLVTNQACLADLHGEGRAVALAESNVVASSAAVLAPLAVGAFDAVGFGWQAALLVAGPMLGVLGLMFRDVRLPAATRVAQGSKGGERLPAMFWLFWGVLFLVGSVEWCMAYWGTDFLAEVVGLRRATAATAMSLFFAAMVVGRFSGARLTRKRSSTTLLLGALAVAVAGFPVFWLAGSPALSLVGLFVAGIGIANFYPLTLATAMNVASADADRATARLAVSGGSALLLTPLLVGVLADRIGLRWAFGVVLPLMGAAIAVTGLAMRAMQGDAVSGRQPAFEAVSDGPASPGTKVPGSST